MGKWLQTYLLLTAALNIIVSGNGTIALSAEKQLIKTLIHRYKEAGKIGRPVKNETDPILVYFGLALIQILNLDERNQVLTISTWNRLYWRDYFLAWNASDYANLTSVRVPASQLWTPDIILYNYADERLSEYRDAMAVISHEGDVLWIPPSIYKSSCSIDIVNFPFDTQRCHLKFGSWTYDGFKLDMDFYQGKNETDLNDYVESNEWDVVSYGAIKNVIRYPCCIEPYPDLTFTLVLRRKVAFYSYILILPCVLLSVLTGTLYWLPPESPAKTQLGINIFVAFFILLLLLAESTPPASKSIPLIGAYYCFNMIMITLSTFMAVTVVHMVFRGERKNSPPKWVKKVCFDVMAKIFLMHNYVPRPPTPAIMDAIRTENPKLTKEYKRLNIRELKHNRYQPSEGVISAPIGSGGPPPPAAPVEPNGDGPTKLNGGNTAFTPLIGAEPQEGGGQAHQVQQPGKQHHPNCRYRSSNGYYYVPTSGDSGCPPDKSPIPIRHSMENDIREIRRMMKATEARQQREEAVSLARSEWRAVALILDRLFFLIYVISVVVSLGTIFPRTP